MVLPKTAVIALTSARAPFYANGGETGVFISEGQLAPHQLT